jgi:O-antigen/teichoic acid export membrane protein
MTADTKTREIQGIDESLHKIAKGASLVFIGLLGTILAVFIGKLIIIRYWTEDEYGIFSIALTILILLSTISTLGLSFGLSRSIAYIRGKREFEKIPDLIFTSLLICIIVSVVSSSIIFLFSDYISLNIFHEPRLSLPLKIFSIPIPFLTLINVIISIFRGFDNVKPTVIFSQLLWNILFPIFLIIIIFLNKTFINIFYAAIASIIITWLILILYTTRSVKKIKFPPLKLYKSKINKEIIFFSLPLLGASIFSLLITWTDTLILGVISGTYFVGLYNGVLPLALFITFPLSALITIFVPIFSGLYAKKQFPEIKRNFSILTKWLSLTTTPIFMIFLLYPNQIINFLFGPNYVIAADVLRILAIGFMINTFFGPNGATLISMGRSYFILIATFSAAVLNIILNFSLIPIYGMIGAALASALSMLYINLIRGVKLYSINKVHPLNKNFFKPMLLTFPVIILLYLLLDNLIIVNIWMIPIIFILYYILYIGAILFTKSVDQEDLKMLEIIEQRTGIKQKLIRKMIKKFL